MPFRYKVNVLEKLKEKGYSTNRIRKEHLLSESTLQKFRTGDTNLKMETIEQICRLLECQPTDIIDFTIQK